MANCAQGPGHLLRPGTWEYAVVKLKESLDALDSRLTALDDPDFQVKDWKMPPGVLEPVNGQDVKPVECIVCGRTGTDLTRIPETSWIVRTPDGGPRICGNCIAYVKTLPEYLNV